MKASSGEIRRFGMTLLIGFGLMGAFLWFRHKSGAAAVFWGVGGAVGLLALAWPRGAAPVHKAWTRAGRAVGAVVSGAAAVLIYGLVMTPAGLLLRLRGHDPLNLKKRENPGGGFWKDVPAPPDKSYYDHIF